jgi:hypothetical protein
MKKIKNNGLSGENQEQSLEISAYELLMLIEISKIKEIKLTKTEKEDIEFITSFYNEHKEFVK